MPQVACPGCEKTYKVPEGTIAVATCKACGKKFRIGAKSPTSLEPGNLETGNLETGNLETGKAKSSKANLGGSKLTQSKRPPAPSRTAEGATPEPSDSFWDEALDENVDQYRDDRFEVEAPAAEPVNHMAASAIATAEAQANKPQKKVRWGFQWGKFFGGLAIFLLAGGAAALLIVSTGRIRRGTAALAMVGFGGLFTMISGLMGEEGIW